MGMKWFQHAETKVSDHTTQFTDVRQFIQECSLAAEVDAEMEAVADTFRGVENLHGVFLWEGSSGDLQAKNEQKRHKHVESFANDHHTFRANRVLQDARPVRINSRSADNWVKLGSSQRTRLLWSYLWKLLPQTVTTSSKHSIELIEFARDLGNSNNTPQTQ